MSIVKNMICPLLQIGTSIKNKNKMANSEYPDDMDHYEVSHLDLHGLQRYLY